MAERLERVRGELDRLQSLEFEIQIGRLTRPRLDANLMEESDSGPVDNLELSVAVDRCSSGRVSLQE